MGTVFVSYARTDSALVEPLVSALDAAGHQVWIDSEMINPGTDWRTSVERGIEASDLFALVVTPTSLASEMCRSELDLALKHGKHIVPIRAERQGDLDAEVARLVAVLAG